MSLIKRNILANLIGSAWVALISVAFIPLYIHFMGVESYGLVGFYLSLQALFALLDLGLTATVSRELAKLSALPGKQQEMRDMVRTLEAIYWGIAVLIGILATLIAPWVATSWLNINTLSVETAQQALILMGIMIALRMPYGFYGGGLMGLQRQVLLNLIKVLVETLRSGGSVLVLWLVSPDITSFLTWQLIISGSGLCLIMVVVWKCLPRGARASFQPGILRGIWRFAAGISGISILTAILTQLDKLVLSKMLPLESFAYYALASTVALGLTVVIGPVYSALYPKFTQLVASDEETELIALYHKSCQFMTVLVMPVAIVLCIYSEDVLRIWTRDPYLSSQAAPILSLLIMGTALNGMLNLPYAIQLAYGWTRLAIYANIIGIIILVPTLITAVSFYGAVGGAAAWLALNFGYIVFGMPIMHRRFLKSEMKYWFSIDVGGPAISAILVVTFFWLVSPDGMGDLVSIIWVLFSYGLAGVAAFYSAPALRPMAKSWLRKLAESGS